MEKLPKVVICYISEFIDVPLNLNKYIFINSIEKWNLCRRWLLAVGLEHNLETPESDQLKILYELYLGRTPGDSISEVFGRCLEYLNFCYPSFIKWYINNTKNETAILELGDIMIQNKNMRAFEIVDSEILEFGYNLKFQNYKSYILYFIFIFY